MSESEIRKPMQKRSIEKREKIIDCGFELICEKGYHNTNTAEIAKKAGVSTGIVYQYFKDKHDILIEALKKYADNIFYPMINIGENDIGNNDIYSIIKNMIEYFIQNHKLSESAHEEITAMAHLDKDVALFFQNREMNMTKTIYDTLIKYGFDSNNLMEKVHIAFIFADNLCHEIVYHKHESLDYQVMIDICIKSIINILKNQTT